MKFCILFFATFSLALNSCEHSQPWSKQQAVNTLSIMAYNLENLFDTKHDKGTEDFTYLPKKDKAPYVNKCKKMTNSYYKGLCLNLDWSQKVLNKKLNNLAKAILQVGAGRGPDILIVSEVENLRVLQLLNKKLKNSNYKITHIEGFDKRGIDVAFFSRLKTHKKAVLHRIPFKGRNARDQKWMSRSRGILEATFVLPKGKLLSVFGLHFPSPRNPSYWRKQAIAKLNNLVKALPSKQLAVAGGDFNISKKEGQKNYFYEKDLASVWKVSHLEGCYSCKGTYIYKGVWSFLDAILIRRTKASSWSLVNKSISVPSQTRVQTNRFLQPARYNIKTGHGTSDHFPIYLQIKNSLQNN